MLALALAFAYRVQLRACDVRVRCKGAVGLGWVRRWTFVVLGRQDNASLNGN